MAAGYCTAAFFWITSTSSRTGRGALVQGGRFLRRELKFVDLSRPRAPSFPDAYEKSLDPIFAFEVGGAGQHLFLVLQNRLRHLHGGGGRGIVGAAGLQILDDFGAAVAGAVDEAVERAWSRRSVSGMPETLLGGRAGPSCRRGRPARPR